MSRAGRELLVGIAVLAVVMGIVMLVNAFVHDDWTCAFKRCVWVKP